jgi:hypothetical protein
MNKSSGSTWLLYGWNSNKNTMNLEGADEIDLKLTARKGIDMFKALESEYVLIGELD